MDDKYILIAEDDVFIGKVYLKRLEKEGFTVEHVTNGKETLEKLKERKPDLLLLDLIMPVMDGFEVLEELENQGQLKDLNIIVLSNLGQEDDIKKAKEHGITEYLVKTENSLPDIVSKVTKHLK